MCLVLHSLLPWCRRMYSPTCNEVCNFYVSLSEFFFKCFLFPSCFLQLITSDRFKLNESITEKATKIKQNQDRFIWRKTTDGRILLSMRTFTPTSSEIATITCYVLSSFFLLNADSSGIRLCAWCYIHCFRVSDECIALSAMLSVTFIFPQLITFGGLCKI